MRRVLLAVALLAVGVCVGTLAGSAAPGDLVEYNSSGALVQTDPAIAGTPCWQRGTRKLAPAGTPFSACTPPTTTTTTSSSTTTTTSPATTTTSPATTTTTQPPSGTQFVESFTGNTGKDRLRVGAFHRERDAFDPARPDWVSDEPWQADHTTSHDDCGPATGRHPQAARTGDTFHDADLTFVCRDHLMSTMGDVSGYSVAWFSPDQSFPTIGQVCFDASIHAGLTGDRSWWEVAVQPFHTVPAVSAIDWLAGTANLPTYGQVGAVVLSFGPANPPYYRVSVRDTSDTPVGDPDAEAFNDAAIRRAHCFTDTAAGLRFESWERLTDGSLGAKLNDATVAGDFPAGPLEVVFKSHAYTPGKSCTDTGWVCESYTWHWDNLRVS